MGVVPMNPRSLTYQEFLAYSREQQRLLDVERKRTRALEAAVQSLEDRLANGIHALAAEPETRRRKVA